MLYNLIYNCLFAMSLLLSLSLLLIGDDSIDALALQVLRVIRLVVLIAPAEESQTCVLHL